ncbi:hypothetical protein A3C60_00475 [Candidatus Nomurabacteria bacterium RIFCSPHIGHO2_02_FULL_37_45]|nr:MAG: hypothetical protein A3C60_00475 [Candidatus Nomurabacteria bacterium RIFCSPHIGHO2_02_FULL_37_45]OGI85380.1 MAG: hypothetical protein A3A92_01590 [Candidatus Nomurabacteria bacterium RIFCSPLOWO2_01_FULL_37_49]
MESYDEIEPTKKEHPHKNKVHRILAHSYLIYFILLLIGVSLDLIFRFKISTNVTILSVGAVFLVFGTILILWAQRTSRDLKKNNISKETFCHGPYCYTRSPTHWGLFFLILGFGIIANAVFVIFSTVISFFLTRFIFLEKQENILAEKYGVPYLEYKKMVKF